MRSKLLFFLAAWLIIIASVISLYHLAYVQKIYPHLSVGSIDISNLTLIEAENRLKSFIPKNPPEIKLTFGNQSWSLSLTDLQVEYDPKRTAEKAFLRGRSRGFFQDLGLKWQQWFNKANLSMEVKIDQLKLMESVELIIKNIEEEPILPALILSPEGKINLITGRNGRLVEKEKLLNNILTRINELNFGAINIPIKLINIDVSGDELMKAQLRAENLKEKILVLQYQDFSQKISGQELINLIGFKTEFSQEKIAAVTANLSQSLNRPAQNAVFQFENGKVIEFKPALPGINVNETETSQRILASLNSWQPVKISVSTTEPKIKTEQVNDLGIKEVLGKGESYFYHSIPGRIHNVALTAAKLNGVLIAPGETFSFNQTVGDISRQTGYQAAYVIQNGRTVLGDGGGVCQDSTTLFRAVLNSGLNIMERRAHAYRVSYYENGSPPGFDATVFAPSPDFKFINDTPAYVLIQTTVDLEKLYLKIEIYGTNDGRKTEIGNIRIWGQAAPPAPLYQDDPTLPVGQIRQVDWAAWGAKAAFDWLVTRNGETLHQQTFYSSYQPWQAVYLRGTGV